MTLSFDRAPLLQIGAGFAVHPIERYRVPFARASISCLGAALAQSKLESV